MSIQTIKIVLSIAVFGLIGFFVWYWGGGVTPQPPIVAVKQNSDASSRPFHTTDTQRVSTRKPEDFDEIKISSKSNLETNFWELVNQPVIRKQSFDNLFKGKTNIPYNDYVKFYNRYLGTTDKFDKFKNIDFVIRQRSAQKRDLEILKNELK